MSGAFSVREASEPGDALIRIAGRADLAGRSGLVLRVPDLGDQAFRPAAVTTEGNDLLMRVGPDITERLEAGAHYDVVVPNAGEDVAGNVRWPAIRPRMAGTRSVFDLPGRKTAEPAPPPVPPLGPSVRTGTITPNNSIAPVNPTVAPPRPRWVLPAVAAAALLSVGLGGAWWAFSPSVTPVTTPAIGGGTVAGSSSGVASAPPAADAGRSPASPAAAPLASLRVPDVIARAGSAAAIGQEGNKRLDSGRPDDGVLLLESAAKQGDAASMARLARLYDPDGFDPKGPIPSPDIREAARYYRDAVQAGDNVVADARARLQGTLQTQAAGGDQSAQLALKDFWP